MNRAQLAQQAMREASRLRASKRIGPADSICPFDLAMRCDLTVQFLPVPSLEGMYATDPGTIVVGSERPAGRRRFTCAHELGHHVFKHGTRLDQLGADTSRPEEFLAESFAASLLMPKIAVDAAIHRRGWSRRPLSAQMMFILAQDLGVGYDTLLTHLNLVLRYLSGSQTALLGKRKLPDIRDELANFSVPYDAFWVKQHWGARPVDLEVGDVVLGGGTTNEGGSLEQATDPRPHFRAVRSGLSEIFVNGRSISVRVSRREYSGRAQFRHEEDVEGDE